MFRRGEHSSARTALLPRNAIKVLTRTATLYTRDRESVLLMAEPVDMLWRLTVMGPGEASKAYDFDDLSALGVFQDSLERDLVDRGFRLQATAERRRGMDRSQVVPFDGVDRRRLDEEIP